MRSTGLLAIVVLSCITRPLAHGQGEKGKSDQDLIRGTWKIVGVEKEGKTEKAHSFLDSLRFTPDQLLLIGNDPKKTTSVYTYKLDATKQPKTIDTTHDLKGRQVVEWMIYDLNGDELKLSWSGEGGPRPNRLESKVGDSWESLVLKRVKDKK
jgi:uncharacterized protein (TIGR03067 family)